ncbi:TIM-barrel domain-containing protein [Rufibacter sp. DG15C]|uniref:glycoside hydrolase family 31 protein n=1 Tax=Rufibacter sp. DG15C TaxID=1379909 RepID=UPI000B019F01|nr:TIM-barrel domain-containing protein [Rufibacter sp. DG15C]
MDNSIQDHNYMLNELSAKREEFFPGTVQQVQQADHHIIFICDNRVALRLEVVTDSILRFRFATEGAFGRDFSYAVEPQRKPSPPSFEFKELTDHYRVTTQDLICTISKVGMRARMLDRSGILLNEDEKGFHWEEHKDYGGDIVKMSKVAKPHEFYYGLGDKANNMNLRGERFENWGADTYGYGKGSDPLYKNINFFMGLHNRNAYGVFFDNTFRSFFDFGRERKDVTSFWAQGGTMDYYFIYGPTLLEVVQKYTVMTGTPELPPLWSLGYHQCKWSYYPEKVVKDLAKGFRERQIPCDALYLDIDYMEGFRCFTWSKEHFPDPARLVKELKDDGFKTVVIIDPGIKIDPDYWVYQEGVENDYFCRRADGPLYKGTVWPGLCHFPDYTREDVREWWSGLFKGLISEVGVKGVWNDMNEPAVFEIGTFPNDVRHHFDGEPGSHRKAHNIYGMQMARATYEGVKRFSYPDRPFTITRSGYAGVQRYASVWTGDNIASWEHLWLANIQCQRLSISGISFVGSDIGGFIETPDGELYIRWLQLGVFHPFCRTHSSGDHGEQEPWSFGEPFTSLARKFIELRYQLLPYLYTTFWQYTTHGTPMLRPLALLDQNDPECYERMAEFCVGDHLLICPITQAGVDGRVMYLPQGQWYDFWTDKVLLGKQEFWATAPLDQIPMFVRAGAVIPFYPVQQFVGEKEIPELTLHVYYSATTCESVLYEDGGDGYGYEEGQYLEKTFQTATSLTTYFLTQHSKGKGESQHQTFRVIFHGMPAATATVLVDNEEIAFEASEDFATLTVVVPSSFQLLSLHTVISPE